MNKLKFKLLSLFVLITLFFASSITSVLAAVSYTYDANGNMLSDGIKCYHYNEANQLDKVTVCAGGQTIAEYVYDYNGTRLVKKEFENGVLKRTIYSPADEYETVKQASNGATQNTSYYKANDELVAKKNPDGTLIYYHNDHLGSSSVLSSQAGTLVEKTLYEPYGEVKSGGLLSKFQYTGQEKDNETGLNYYGARYYDSHVQRFTQPDETVQDMYNPQDLNRFAYTRNNPLKYIDPSGHDVIYVTDPFGAGGAGHTYMFYQDGANVWHKASFNPVSLVAIETLKVGVGPFSVKFPVITDAYHGTRGFYEVTTEENFDVQEKLQTLADSGASATFHETSMQQNINIDKNVKKAQASINSRKVPYVLRENNCKTVTCSILKAARVQACSTMTVVPNEDYVVNKSKIIASKITNKVSTLIKQKTAPAVKKK